VTNRHFGRISEVWKHLVLAEALASERPDAFLDTHAGDALYPAVDDPERRYGALTFNEVADRDAVLHESAYAAVLSPLRRGATLSGIPGGPLVAMGVLGNAAEYVFCDLDPESTDNIRDVAMRHGLSSVRVLNADGMGSVRDAISSLEPSRTAVFMDPFDHRLVGSAGLSALDLASEVARAGALLVYWYGYNRIDQRRWIFNVLTERAQAHSWWCGDVMVSAESVDMTTGDLGVASSPGTGSGLVCANVSKTTIERVTVLGTALAAAYSNRPLPTGITGSLDFSTGAHP